MTLDEEARSAIDAARQRARRRAPRRESPPDPRELPDLPPSPLEDPEPPASGVGDHIPDEFLYTPSQSLRVWTDIWERDVRFRFGTHRGPLGRLLVFCKRLLAPLVRAPLADVLQRERIFGVVVLRMLERQSAEIRKYLLQVRDPYSYVRDWAIPDLLARTDALFSILDRRLDALESEVRGRGVGSRNPAAASLPSPAGALEADLSLVTVGAAPLRECKRVLAIGGGEGERLLLALDSAGIALERVVGDLATDLEGRTDGSLEAAVGAASLGEEGERRLRALCLLRAKLRPGAPLVLFESGGARAADALGVALRAVGFRTVEASRVREDEPARPPARVTVPRAKAAVAAKATGKAPATGDDALAALASDVNRALEELDRRLGAERPEPVLLIARP